MTTFDIDDRQPKGTGKFLYKKSSCMDIFTWYVERAWSYVGRYVGRDFLHMISTTPDANFYVGRNPKLASGGISTFSVVVFFASGGIFLHRVALFYIGWHFFTSGGFFYIWCKQQLHQVFHSAVDNIDEQQRSTTLTNENNQRQRLTTTMTIKPTTTIIDDIHNRWRSLTTLKIDVDHSRHWWSTTLTNDNDRQQNWRSTRRLRSLTTIIDDIHDWWRSLTTFTIDVDHWRHWRTTTIDDDHWPHWRTTTIDDDHRRHWRTTTIDDDHRRHWRTKSMTTMSMKTTTTIIDDTEES